MKTKMVDIKGNDLKEIEIDDYIFDIKPNQSVIYEAIKNELANKRQGTASTKTKAEVSGTGAKPWRQKGTGRARVGTKRNPVWYHGGVAFGPKPRDYSYKIPKKIKNLAYRSVFSLKNKAGNIVFVENIKLENSKTKEMKSIADQISPQSKNVFIITDSESDKMLRIAGRNLVNLKFLSFDRLNINDLYYNEKIIITEDALNGLDQKIKKFKVKG